MLLLRFDGMNEQQQNQYLEAATSLGYDITSPKSVRNLITALLYNEIWMFDRTLTDAEICQRIGVTRDQLIDLKNSEAHKVATRIMLAEFTNDKARQDVRYKLFGTYQEYMLKALTNIAKIASGEIISKTDEGKEIRAGFRDQVAAATLLINNPLANAWLSNTFYGEQQNNDEEAAQAYQQKLLGQSRVLNLDDDIVIEGTAVVVKPAADTDHSPKSDGEQAR